MKIGISESREIVLKEVYSGVLLETEEGHQLGICMRDDTFEINVIPKGDDIHNWHHVDMVTGTIERTVMTFDVADTATDPVGEVDEARGKEECEHEWTCVRATVPFLAKCKKCGMKKK